MPSRESSPPLVEISVDTLISQAGKALPGQTLDASFVVLLWPYSSINHKLSLILAEPRFHTERIRVSFSGSAADAVAHSGVSVGDSIALCLDGARWEGSGSSDSGSALHFHDRLKCEIYRENVLLAEVKLHEQASSSVLSLSESETSHFTGVSNSQTIPSSHVLPLNEVWSSPAILKRANFAASALFANSLTSFDDDDFGEVDTRPRKKRKSWRDVKTWRTSDKAQSSSSDGDISSVVGNVNNEEQLQKLDSEHNLAVNSQLGKSSGSNVEAIPNIEERRPGSKPYNIEEEKSVVSIEESPLINMEISSEQRSKTGSQTSLFATVQKPDRILAQGSSFPNMKMAQKLDDNLFEANSNSMKSVDGGFSDVPRQPAAQIQLNYTSTTLSASYIPDTSTSLQEPIIDRLDSMSNAIPTIDMAPEDTNQSVQPLLRLQTDTSNAGTSHFGTVTPIWRPHTPSLEPVRSPALPVPSPLPRDPADGLAHNSEIVKNLSEPLLTPKSNALQPATNKAQNSPSLTPFPRISFQETSDGSRGGEHANQHHMLEELNNSPRSLRKSLEDNAVTMPKVGEEHGNHAAEVPETQFLKSRADALEKDGASSESQSAKGLIPTDSQSMRKRSDFSTYRSTHHAYASSMSSSSSDETVHRSDLNLEQPNSHLSKLQALETTKDTYFSKLAHACIRGQRMYMEGRREPSAVGMNEDDVESDRSKDSDELDRLDEDDEDEEEEEEEAEYDSLDECLSKERNDFTETEDEEDEDEVEVEVEEGIEEDDDEEGSEYMESSHLSELAPNQIKTEAEQLGYWEVLLGENRNKGADNQDTHGNSNIEEAIKSRNTVEIIDLGSDSEEDETETRKERYPDPSAHASDSVYYEHSAVIAQSASGYQADEEREDSKSITSRMQIRDTDVEVQPAQSTYTSFDLTDASMAADSYSPLHKSLDREGAVNFASEVTMSETIDETSRLKSDAAIVRNITAQSDSHLEDQNESLKSVEMPDQSNITGHGFTLQDNNGLSEGKSNEQYTVMSRDQSDGSLRRLMNPSNQRDSQELNEERSKSHHPESSLEPWRSSSSSVEVVDLSQPDPSNLSQYRSSAGKSVNLDDAVGAHEKFVSSSQQRTVVPDSEDSLDSEKSSTESEPGNFNDQAPIGRGLHSPVFSDTHSEKSFTTHEDYRPVPNSDRQYSNASVEESTSTEVSALERRSADQSGKVIMVKETQYEADVKRLGRAINSEDNQIAKSNATLRNTEVQSSLSQLLHPDGTNAQTSLTEETEESQNILSGKNDEKHADLSLPVYPTTQALLASSSPTEHIDKISGEIAKKRNVKRKAPDGMSDAGVDNIVPKVLSQWFAPRTSDISSENSNVTLDASQHSNHVEIADQTIKKEYLSTRGKESTDPLNPPTITKSSQSTQVSGLRTPSSYYHPLATIDAYLNSQGELIDTLSVACRDSKPPTRAGAGPKDFYTIFRITDPSVWPKDTLVQAFRPWSKALPSVRKGDVVMLRSMRLKSRKRRPYLMSCDESAWCVWKEDGRKPECAGPPVDIGMDEEKAVKVLRSWWINEAERHSERGRSEDG